MKIAGDSIVELTWWDQYDSRESVEISVDTEYDNGSGDIWLSVEGLTLSLHAWEVLMMKIEDLVEIDGLQKFIDQNKKVVGEIKVISMNKIDWTKPDKN